MPHVFSAQNNEGSLLHGLRVHSVEPLSSKGSPIPYLGERIFVASRSYLVYTHSPLLNDVEESCVGGFVRQGDVFSLFVEDIWAACGEFLQLFLRKRL